MAAAIETEQLSKDYAVGFWRPRPYRALDDVTLSVETGEVFGFLGPNGAGKTTTLKILMQLVFPTAGRAAILGRPVGDLPVRRRIGYLPEHPYFYDYLTAEELLRYFGSLFGLRGEACTRRVNSLLDQVGIGAERKLALRRYSKGMLQRVGLAQALVNEPEVIFLDEPMSGLDPLGRRQVRQMILRLRDEGRTVFFSSHILADAEALCSRVGILAAGRLVSIGRLTDLLALQARGWEVVMSHVSAELAARAMPDVVRATPISDGRFAFELGLGLPPAAFVAGLEADGAQLVSLNPLRETLEDVFVSQIEGRKR